jgi:hypothetical protein
MSALERAKLVAGLVGKELSTSLEDLGKHIGKNIKGFVEKLRNLAAKIYSFTLNIIEKLFSFVADIQKLAKDKKWDMDKLTIEIPSAGFSIISVLGIPIPIPEIKTPTISISFKPFGS